MRAKNKRLHRQDHLRNYTLHLARAWEIAEAAARPALLNNLRNIGTQCTPSSEKPQTEQTSAEGSQGSNFP